MSKISNVKLSFHNPGNLPVKEKYLLFLKVEFEPTANVNLGVSKLNYFDAL